MHAQPWTAIRRSTCWTRAAPRRAGSRTIARSTPRRRGRRRGSEIAFTSDRGGGLQVYVMDREGGNVRRLTYEVNYTDSPGWSPKGDRIAFVARTGAGSTSTSAARTAAARAVVGQRREQRESTLVAGRTPPGVRFEPRGAVRALRHRPRRPAAAQADTGGRAAVSPAWSPRPASDGGPRLNLELRSSPSTHGEVRR